MKIDIQRYKTETQSREIDEIFNNLNTVTKESITALPEEVFVRNFLPFFAGEPVADTINLNVWFGIAGNPYMPVNVVDKSGVVLYTVPAFFDRGAVDISRVDNRASPLHHVLKTAEQLNRVHPKRAEAYFEQQLNMRNMTNLDKALHDRNAQIWEDIFKRYGKELPQNMQAQAPSAQATAASEQSTRSQELIYDDDDLI